ncbi:hypothetical protein M6B38_365300 [Iris pallida]|uniref:Uncharacterized protein n=1 Tax=Iris pallida TaxID=29817 RepID=A0AAX6GHQ2_IRIPA|nr:hypothetical protein M6B38_365300 [Iris pallida]
MSVPVLFIQFFTSENILVSESGHDRDTKKINQSSNLPDSSLTTDLAEADLAPFASRIRCLYRNTSLRLLFQRSPTGTPAAVPRTVSPVIRAQPPVPLVGEAGTCVPADLRPAAGLQRRAPSRPSPDA